MRLRDLLRSNDSLPGQVTRVVAGVVRVATPRGPVDATPDGPLQVGDMVTVRAGRARKSQTSPEGRIEFEV